jgi:hypothetical protein
MNAADFPAACIRRCSSSISRSVLSCLSLLQKQSHHQQARAIGLDTQKDGVFERGKYVVLLLSDVVKSGLERLFMLIGLYRNQRPNSSRNCRAPIISMRSDRIAASRDSLPTQHGPSFEYPC